MPLDYEEAFLCYRLKITYTQLNQQPAKWVEKMIRLTGVIEKYKADKAEAEKRRKRTLKKKL